MLWKRAKSILDRVWWQCVHIQLQYLYFYKPVWCVSVYKHAWDCVYVCLFGRINRHSDDGGDFIRDEIRVMLQYAYCGLIILICPLEFPTAERQLAQ